MNTRTTFKVYALVGLPEQRGTESIFYKRICLQTVNFISEQGARELAEKHKKIDHARRCFFTTEEEL